MVFDCGGACRFARPGGGERSTRGAGSAPPRRASRAEAPGRHGGAAGVDNGGGSLGVGRVAISAGETFGRLIAAILDRYGRQRAMARVDESETGRVAARLWALIESRGRPPIPADGGGEEPPEMVAAEVAPLVAQVLAGLAGAEALKNPVRQLVKACLQAERRTCRESYREAGVDGVCRRQLIDRVRERVSGTHCVDCPHWTALTPERHGNFLAGAWMPTRAAEFAEHREVFLPEDFRALRVFLGAHAAR